MTEGQYHVKIDGQVHGPYTLTDLASLYGRRVIDETTPYRMTEDGKWHPLAGIYAAFQDQIPAEESKPPPIPPPPPEPAPIATEFVVCLNCEYYGPPGKQKLGVRAIDVLLWIVTVVLFLFAVVAIVISFAVVVLPFSTSLFYCLVVFPVITLCYSLWRRSGSKCCPTCQTVSVIPAKSPAAARILASR